MRKLLRSKEAPIASILVLLCMVLALRNPGFLSIGNILDILKGGAVLCILAFGMTLVIITGGIDVSVAAMTSASAVLVGTWMPLLGNGPAALAALFAVAALTGVVMGIVNGVLVAYVRIPPIVVTLGTLSVIGGLTRYLTNGNYINSTNFPVTFMHFADFKVAGVSILIYMFILLGIVTGYLLKYLRIGREIFAVGGNPVSSMRAGISVSRVQLFVYAYMGLLAGFAAMALTAYNKAVDPNGMSGFELTVIAAVVLGGANILGGSGSMVGTVLGALLLEVINNGLTLARIGTYWQQIVIGVIILASVSYDAIRRRQVERQLSRIEVDGEVAEA
ncbi:MAG: ABC transporter permease [Alicyclobacillus sp.]|nr:ABC transporter permease [Alicyclobacillus sp.]